MHLSESPGRKFGEYHFDNKMTKFFSYNAITKLLSESSSAFELSYGAKHMKVTVENKNRSDKERQSEHPVQDPPREVMEKSEQQALRGREACGIVQSLTGEILPPHRKTGNLRIGNRDTEHAERKK